MINAPYPRSELVAKLSAFFSQAPEIRLALLYGSYAKDAATARSDVDIAVAGAGPIDRNRLFELSGELGIFLGREIDLVDLSRIDGLILHRIVTQGIRVKTDPSLYVRFASKAYGYIADFKPLQDRMRASRLRRFIGGSGYR